MIARWLSLSGMEVLLISRSPVGVTSTLAPSEPMLMLPSAISLRALSVASRTLAPMVLSVAGALVAGFSPQAASGIASASASRGALRIFMVCVPLR
ncbi:hypothetical protein D9M71_825720 [compost metagenome]